MAFAHLRPKPAAAAAPAPAPVAAAPTPEQLEGLNRPAPPIPTPAPTPVVEAAVDRTVVTTGTPQPTAGNPVANFVAGLGLPAVSARGAARTRALSVSGETRESLFPKIQFNAKSGAYVLPKDTPPEIVRCLPMANLPWSGLIMAYRLSVVSWPVGHDFRTDDNKAPAWTAAIGGDNEAWDDVVKGAWNFQYTPKPEKVSWDFATSGIGHIGVALDLLAFLAPSGAFGGGLVQISTPNVIGSTAASLETLEPFLPVAADGSPQAFAPFAATVSIGQEAKVSKGGAKWTEYHFAIAGMAATPEWAALMKAANAWGSTLDADTRDRFGKWVRGADEPLTDKGREAIARAVARGR